MLSRSRTPRGQLAVLLAILLLGSAAHVHAGADYDTTYDQAVADFEAGRDQEALAGFRRLQAAGIDDPAIDFNLGAVQYRLADYEEAIAAFGRAARDRRLAALAAYNAALSAWRMGDRHRASDWLQHAQEASPNAELAQLIDELRRTMTPQQLSRPGGLAQVSIGYDSNVTLRAEDETLSESGTGDAWLEFYGDFEYEPARLAAAGVSLHGGAWLLTHQDLHEYDSALFRLGITHGGQLDAWRLDTDFRIEHTQADGAGLTSGYALRFDASRPLRSGHTLRLGAEAGWTHESHSRFAYLAGSHQAVEVESVWRFSGARVRASYRYENHDRDDLREPLFISASPRRHELGGDVRFRLGDRTGIETGLRFRRSRYADPNELADGSSLRREDDRFRMLVSLNRSIGRDREIRLQFERTINHSSIAAYDYRQNWISCGLRLLW